MVTSSRGGGAADRRLHDRRELPRVQRQRQSLVALGYPFDGSGNYYLTGDEDDLPTGTDQPMSFCVTTTGLTPVGQSSSSLKLGRERCI